LFNLITVVEPPLYNFKRPLFEITVISCHIEGSGPCRLRSALPRYLLSYLVDVISRTSTLTDLISTYRAAPATASKREPPHRAKRDPPHRRHDGREMSDRIAAELREAYGAMTRFVHLMRRACSTAPPELQFSHLQTIYASNSMIISSTKYKKAEKSETGMITRQNTHLSGKGIEYTTRPKAKFNVESFRFLVHRNIKYPIIYPYVHC